MNQEFQAIYENGVLRLVQPLDLPEQTPVRGFVAGLRDDATVPETAQAEVLAKQRKALNAMWEKIATIPQTPTSDGLSNRDHDAILYGQEK